MDQQQINRQEWENPLNWSGPVWVGVYRSRRDSRTWVPKRLPAMGWTLNFGRRAAWAWLGAVVAVAVLVALLAAHA